MASGDTNLTNLDLSGDLKKSGSTVPVHASETLQNLVADGAITVKNGVVKIAKTVAGVVAATLADPVTGTDDYKRLLIISDQAQLNTVTSGSSFGGGGGGEDVITFSGVIGDCVELMAYGGKWYIVGGHQFTVA